MGRNNGFTFKQFHIDHDRCAMKVGTDGILLGAWAPVDSARRVLDIGTPAEKHDHVDIELANGKLLRLNDPRRFGALLWTREPAEAHALLAKLGPEPLTDAFHADYLRERAKGRSTAIKQFLMDNHVVVGVGNIYANEALYAAGIHPRRVAGNISAERLGTLVSEIKRVLAEAIRQGGTTLKDFTSADGKPG